jgi:tetraprenyl-beta-curcumene synthase
MRDIDVLARTLSRYWITLFPIARDELRHLRRRAEAIPDPVLRAHALDTLAAEHQNAESAAVFAVLASPRHRKTVARLLVSYQAMYDFLDTLTEQPSTAPLRNSRHLHTALVAALGGPHPRAGYYAHQSRHDDGGYLDELVRSCAARFRRLPSADATALPLWRAARRAAESQSQNHAAMFTGSAALIHWAVRETPADTGLAWWETAAAGGSSLAVHALLGAAGDRDLTPASAEQIERAYWPWVSALNTLLESVVDMDDDAETGNHSYASHYADAQQMAARLGSIADSAADATRGLPRDRVHAVIVAAMAAFYLAQLTAVHPNARPAAHNVRMAFGANAGALLAMLRLRRRLTA